MTSDNPVIGEVIPSPVRSAIVVKELCRRSVLDAEGVGGVLPFLRNKRDTQDHLPPLRLGGGATAVAAAVARATPCFCLEFVGGDSCALHIGHDRENLPSTVSRSNQVLMHVLWNSCLCISVLVDEGGGGGETLLVSGM
jgi:hypothetical protein